MVNLIAQVDMLIERADPAWSPDHNLIHAALEVMAGEPMPAFKLWWVLEDKFRNLSQRELKRQLLAADFERTRSSSGIFYSPPRPPIEASSPSTPASAA